MRTEQTAEVLGQIDEILEEVAALQKGAKHSDLSDIPEALLTRAVTRARAAIHRIAGKPSVYVDQCEEIMRMPLFTGERALRLSGVLHSLRADTSMGYLESQRELLHGELFGDFLEMAQHLLDEGYKDAAAVIAGSSLEAHLRQLCLKSGILIEVKSTSGITPKKADRLNADLAGKEVYSRLDQKNVTAWLDLRNKAAHGKYDEYSAPQVGLLISGIRDFLSRHPA